MRADQAGAAGDQHPLISFMALSPRCRGAWLASVAPAAGTSPGTPATTANGGDVGGHDRAGADDRALADRDAREDGRIGADVGPRADAHRLDLEVGLHDRHVDRHAGVGRAEHLRARAPADVVLEHQVARVEVGLRADPHVVADHARAVEAALDVGLRADEDAVADLEGLEVLEADAAADLQPCPQRRAAARQIARRISASSAPSPMANRP